MQDRHPVAEPPGNKGSRRSFWHAALVLGALSVTAIAIGLVIVLLSWVNSLSQHEEPHLSAQPRPREGQPVASGDVPTGPASVAAATPIHHEPVPVDASLTPPAAPLARPAAVSNPPDREAKRNRQLGQSLSHLAEDPEAQRELGIGGEAPPR